MSKREYLVCDRCANEVSSGPGPLIPGWSAGSIYGGGPGGVRQQWAHLCPACSEVFIEIFGEALRRFVV